MAWDEWRKRRKRRFLPFRGIDEIMREMERMMEEMFRGFTERAPGSFMRERRPSDRRVVRRTKPIGWGYSIFKGPYRKPVIREFGNLKPSAQRRVAGLRFGLREEREPLVDIFETEGEVRVVAELPGVEREDINLHSTSNTLTVRVDTAERKYRKELELPSEVDPTTLRSTYKNGVLEVTLRKVEKNRPKGFSIKIE